MARTSDNDKRFLEQHRGKWRVILAVPARLQKAVGLTKLKRALNTDSLAVANELKWAVVKDLKDSLRTFEKNSLSVSRGERTRVLQEAARLANTLEAYPAEQRYAVASDHLEERVMTILGAPVGYDTVIDAHGPEEPSDHGTRVPIHDPEKVELADAYMAVALHGGKPIANADSLYKEKRLRVSHRTQNDHDRALRMLAAFCIEKGIGDDVGKIDEYVVTDFVAHLENTVGLSARTIKKYVSRLNLYFSYLKSLRQISQNPWRDAVVYMPTAKNSELERPFTEQEIVTLLTGPAKPVMHDLMRMGALTGARLDAIVDLKVGDIIDGRAFRFKPQKRERGERYVPIHPDLTEIIKRRTAGRGPDEPFFPEYPPDPNNPLVERSFRASKGFTTYRRSVGVDEVVPGKRRSRVNFHSFRRWFITKGERTLPPEGMIAALVGHARKGMTLAVYSEGPEMKAARKTIEKIKLPPLDESPVVQPEAITPRS